MRTGGGETGQRSQSEGKDKQRMVEGLEKGTQIKICRRGEEKKYRNLMLL